MESCRAAGAGPRRMRAAVTRAASASEPLLRASGLVQGENEVSWAKSPRCGGRGGLRRTHPLRRVALPFIPPARAAATGESRRAAALGQQQSYIPPQEGESGDDDDDESERNHGSARSRANVVVDSPALPLLPDASRRGERPARVLVFLLRAKRGSVGVQGDAGEDGREHEGEVGQRVQEGGHALLLRVRG